MLHTKYIRSGPHGFREKDFFKFFPLGHNKLIVRFSFIFFSKWGPGAEILFFIFPYYTEIGNGWLKFILISANHMYLVNRILFIIPMYYEKKQMLCVIIRIALKEQL